MGIVAAFESFILFQKNLQDFKSMYINFLFGPAGQKKQNHNHETFTACQGPSLMARLHASSVLSCSSMQLALLSRLLRLTRFENLGIRKWCGRVNCARNSTTGCPICLKDYCRLRPQHISV